jgi:uncharacterized protein
MSGETNLRKLLAEMSPQLNAGEYTFCTLPVSAPIPVACHLVGLIQEMEGTSIIVPRNEADTSGLKYDFIAAWITLTIHSDLEAVGLTAAISRALAEAGIPCNVVAGYYHDHLFVPANKAGHAMDILKRLGE